MEPPGVMEQEGAYLAALPEAGAYRTMGDRLAIEDGTGEAVLVYGQKERAAMDPRDLLGTAWQLVSLNGASPVEGSTITLVFDGDGRASGLAGCREYTATYEAEGDRIHFLSQSMSGDEDCLADEALYWQEGAYTDALTWATSFRFGEGRLEIETARGELLAFEVMDGEPVISPEPAKDDCSGYLDLVVSASSDEVQTVVTCYQCDRVHVDSTGQSPGSASISVRVDTPLRLHFRVEVPPDRVAARVYAGTGLSASFFRWPEELPGGAQPVVVLDDFAGQSFELEPQLASGEYSVVIQAAWDGDIEVFYAFSFRIG
jgi:heat shock protein HslJ